MSRRPLRFLLLPLLLGFALGSPVRSQVLSRDEQLALQDHLEVLWLAQTRYGQPVDYEQLSWASIQGFLRRLDPHTNFLSPAAYDDMRQRQQGSFFGLGILVSMRNGKLTVVSPIEGTPAARRGIRSGDIIDTIEGEPTEPLSLDEAISRLKGPRDTQVNITIVRRGFDEPIPMTVTRAEIPQTTVRYAYMMTPETGYIRLTDFSRSTSREMAEALARLTEQGMERLLLDLRGNGGGLMDAAIETADLFLPQGCPIVGTRGRLRDSFQQFWDEPGPSDPWLDLPLVVLVNDGTASAAEILSGAIQDQDVGLVVGTQTWGKALVQTVYNLSYGAGLALTTARYHTPSGRMIQRDYSSYFDYYRRHAPGAEEAPASNPDPTGDPQQFETELGRIVRGGGGITPDVLSELPDGPTGLQLLFVTNAFFDFAIDYQRSTSIPSDSWQPPADLLEEFSRWLQQEEIATEEEIEELFADQEARQFTERQIHSDLFNAVFGTETAHRVLARGDPQIQEALGLFGQASDLLDRRRAVSCDQREEAPPPAAGPHSFPPPEATPAISTPSRWPAPLQASFHFVHATLLAEASQFGEAQAEFRRSIQLEPTDPYRHLALAALHATLADMSLDRGGARRELEAAVAAVAEARDLAPADVTVLLRYAQLNLRLAEFSLAALDVARETYESLRGMTEGDLQVLTDLAQIYLWDEEWAKAAEVLREADSHSTSNRSIQGMLAEALLRMDAPEEAIPLLERLSSDQADSLPLLFDLGLAYERAGRRERSVETFRRLLELDPDHAPALNYLGYMWAEQAENLEEAHHLILRAVAIEPDNVNYVDSLGWVLHRLGRHDEARGHLEWASRLDPENPVIQEHLGDVYVALEEFDHARVSYQRALELGGDNAAELQRKLLALSQ